MQVTATHALRLVLPLTLHRQLRERATAEHRSVVGHIRYLIEEDVKAAAEADEPVKAAA